MGIEKQSSKGGFLQLFDWKAKSRKKLFSSKSDLPEQSKQKKRSDGNFPMTQLQMLDEDAGSIIKEGSDYSCASSVNDEDFHRTKAPGVVARLMGLDSLPKSNILEPYSTPLFDSQSLLSANSRIEDLEFYQDPQIMHSGSIQEASVGNSVNPKHQKVIQRPIEKFQTEILPPKSAKSVPITHHKLLSPVKSVNFIPPKDAAQIMEAAARIIEPGSRNGTKTKLPTFGASSVPLKVRDLKEKVQTAHRTVKLSEVSQKPGDFNAIKPLGQRFSDKSSNEFADARSVESSVARKNQGKSISLALQAKANVQKREGLKMNSSRTLVSQKETSEFSPSQTFKSQLTTQKSTLKKPFTQNGSTVLRQNNQKQNCTVDSEKLPLKTNLQSGKALNGDSSSVRQRNSGKANGTSKFNSRKLGSEVKDNKREVMSSSSERVIRKKRSIDGSYLSEKNQDIQNMQMDNEGQGIQFSALNSWDQDSGRTGTDVVSFTFTAPLTRSIPGYGRSMGLEENRSIFSADSRSKRTLLSSDGLSARNLSFPEHNSRGSDALSALLEQKLKELTLKVEFSQQKQGTVLRDMAPSPSETVNSIMLEENKSRVGLQADNLGVLEEMGMQGSKRSQAKKTLDCRLPSPVSVLEDSSITESCNSTDTADSNSTEDGIQCSTVRAHEVLGMFHLKSFLPFEGDAELSDSASSISAGSVAKRHETTLALTNNEKPREWELEYIKEVLCNIDLTFMNHVSGQACEIINPQLFDQLESRKVYFGDCGSVPRIGRRVLFDCVSECLDLRCRKYLGGGYELWAKGMSVVRREERLAEEIYKEVSGWSVSVVRREERLAEEIYKEVSGWSALGDSMVDELVDNDMSSQYGRWLDFEVEAFEVGILIESRVLNSLIDEVVADILVL